MGQKTLVTVISKISERPATREACVVVLCGANLGMKFNLEEPSITIGRSPRSYIRVDHDAVSRHHARIVNDGKQLVLRDLDSTNGTFVNDHRVDERVLVDGDLLKIGPTVFKFLSGKNIEHDYHEELWRLTTVDGLTQIANHKHFLATLDAELSRARRYRRPLSLLFFDIDLFKQVNDEHGHLAGDAVLVQLASVVRSKTRREDVFARYGGEEFAILMPETSGTAARKLAEKVRRLVEKTTFKLDDLRIKVTISVGVADCEEGDRSDSLLRRADEHLYRAKAEGRNCCRG